MEIGGLASLAAIRTQNAQGNGGNAHKVEAVAEKETALAEEKASTYEGDAGEGRGVKVDIVV